MLALNHTPRPLNELQDFHFSAFTQAVVAFAVVIAKWETRYRTRKQLMSLSDAQLEDIGMTPRAAYIEANRWFWQG
ncbi:DUF1127 domain-containing protein [Algirhabdus cladophorae]|uniref:DUF1127 domain-containing protein n=1 Tax=Algirhabdus cladophorae TaxID=3377108 RepID=UPI003B846BB2